MGYTVDFQGADLRCRTKADAEQAARVVQAHPDMHPYHIQVEVWGTSVPPRDDAYVLDVFEFQGDHWNNDAANKLWLALTPHLADESTIEFQSEDRTRWRIRWSGGRVFEEYPKEVIWALEKEILP